MKSIIHYEESPLQESQQYRLSHKPTYLAAYMGHSDFRATQYYLRLTAELYPEIVRMTEARQNKRINEVGDIFPII